MFIALLKPIHDEFEAGNYGEGIGRGLEIGFEVVAGGAAARMVIGEVDLDLLYDRLMTAEAELGRVVNVTVFTTREWTSDDSGFVRHVRKQPVVRLIGPGDD